MLSIFWKQSSAMRKHFMQGKTAMKKIILIINFALLACFGNAQYPYLDTLRKQLAQAKDDNTRFGVLSHLATMYIFVKPDSAMIMAQQSIALAKKINNDTVLSIALTTYGGVLVQTGNYPQAIYFGLEALKFAEKSNDLPTICNSYEFLAGTYVEAEDYEHALFYGRKTKALYESHPNFTAGPRKPWWDYLYGDAMGNLANIYTKLNQPNLALAYLQRASGYLPPIYGDIYFIKGDYTKAISYYREAYPSMGRL
jgi:tetratricopeptide (TPR) repeat protein